MEPYVMSFAAGDTNFSSCLGWNMSYDSAAFLYINCARLLSFYDCWGEKGILNYDEWYSASWQLGKTNDDLNNGVMNDIQFKNALCFVGFFTALLSTIKWTCLEAISALLKTVGFNVSMLLSRVVSKIFSSRNKSWVWKSGLQFETLHLSVNSADSQLSGPKYLGIQMY